METDAPTPRFERISKFSASSWPTAASAIRDVSFPEYYLDGWNRPERPEDFLLLASIGDLVAGYAFLDHGMNPGNCYLREVAVLPSHRGHGLGTQLVRESAAWLAPAFDCMYVQALEDDDFDRRVAWFERLGFVAPDQLTMHRAALADLAS